MDHNLAGLVVTLLSICIIFFALYMQSVREKLTVEVNKRKKQVTETTYRLLLLSNPPIHPKTLEYLNIPIRDEESPLKIEASIVDSDGFGAAGSRWFFVAAGEAPTFILSYPQKEYPATTKTIWCRIPLSSLGDCIGNTLAVTSINCPEAYAYLIRTIGNNLLSAYVCKHTQQQIMDLLELGTLK